MTTSSDAPSILPIVPTQRLFARTAERIFLLIQERGLTAGQKLPSEAELVSLLNVSRPTIREALVALEVVGVVTVRKNVGALVGPQQYFPSSVIETDEAGPFEQLEARFALEPASAALAAQRRSDHVCDALEETIVYMLEEHAGGFQTEVGDRNFHLLIAKASGNALIERSITQLWRMRERSQLWPQLQKLVEIQKWRSKAVYEHMRILEAIRRQDTEAAQEEMLKHLESVRSSFDEAFPK